MAILFRVLLSEIESRVAVAFTKLSLGEWRSRHLQIHSPGFVVMNETAKHRDCILVFLFFFFFFFFLKLKGRLAVGQTDEWRDGESVRLIYERLAVTGRLSTSEF